MIKKILFPLFAIAVLSGCGDNTEKVQENTLLDSVKAVHDKVMGDDNADMRLRKKLKQLAAMKPELNDSVSYYLKKMDDNDNVMMDWMNKFNPDFTGKTHNQIISYLRIQKKQIMGVDSLMKKEAKLVRCFYRRVRFKK